MVCQFNWSKTSAKIERLKENNSYFDNNISVKKFEAKFVNTKFGQMKTRSKMTGFLNQ